MYKNSTGKMVGTYLLSGNYMEELISKGWKVIITKGYKETRQELHDRCIKMGYSKVRVWEVATAIRGYHDIVAMVK